MGRFIYSILVLLLSQNIASAYPSPVDFEGKLMRWVTAAKDRPIYYEIDGDFENDIVAFAHLVDESADMWSSVPNSYLRLEPVPTGETADVTVMFKRSFNGDDFSSGFSHFDQYDDRTPIHCSITVLSTLDVLSIARTTLHEFGHCIGLGHSLIPEAVMSYRLDKNTFKLDTDDMAAVARVYPLDETQKSLAPGCAVGAGHAGNEWILILFVFLWLNRKRSPTLLSRAPSLKEILSSDK